MITIKGAATCTHTRQNAAVIREVKRREVAKCEILSPDIFDRISF